MVERRRREDSFLIKHQALLIYAVASLVAAAIGYGTVQTELKYLRRDVDDLRTFHRYEHGDLPVPGAQ